MLELWHLWVIAGLALFIIEIFTPGFVMGVFGVACLVVAPFGRQTCITEHATAGLWDCHRSHVAGHPTVDHQAPLPPGIHD
jgi:hypothetical protein